MAGRQLGVKPLYEPMICRIAKGPYETNVSEISIEIQNFSLKKMNLKM